MSRSTCPHCSPSPNPLGFRLALPSMRPQQSPQDKAAGQKSSPSAFTKAFLGIKTLKSTVLISGLGEGDYSSSGLQPGLCLLVAVTPPLVMLSSAQCPHPAQHCLHTALQAPRELGKVGDTKPSSPHPHAPKEKHWDHKAELAPGPSYKILGQGRPPPRVSTWTWTSPFRQPDPTLTVTHINPEPPSSFPSLWQ